jgi:hypothetical protein
MTTIQIILSLATIVSSGVMSAIVTYKLNARREECQFRRQKLEEFYMAMSGFCRSLMTHFFTYQGVMEQKTTYNAALDATIEKGTDEKRSCDTTFMLLPIYFPQFQPVFNKLLNCRSTLNAILGEFRESYKAGNPDGTRWLTPFTENLCQIEDIEKQLRQMIQKEAERLY